LERKRRLETFERPESVFLRQTRKEGLPEKKVLREDLKLSRKRRVLSLARNPYILKASEERLLLRAVERVGGI